jgi:nucleotide-binding universal stress UspA family protein
VGDKESDMNTIVVGVDGSEAGKAALRWAITTAKTLGDTQVEALMAWAYPIMPASPFVGAVPPVPVDEIDAATRQHLDEIVAEVATMADNHVEVTPRVVCENATTALLEASQKASLIVLGTRGLGGFAGLLLGSVSHQVATHSDCPVVIVPESAAVEPYLTGRIVVGVDGSEHAATALRWAVAHARKTGATVRAVQVWQYPYVAVSPVSSAAAMPSADLLQEATETALDQDIRTALPAVEGEAPVAVEPVVREGSAVRALLDEATHADLLVVGARGHGGFAGLLLGSVATQVLHHPSGPVVVMPATSPAS